MLEIAQGLAIFFHAKVKDAPFHVGIRVLRVELDRLVDVGKRQVEPVLTLPEVRSFDQCRHIFWVQTNRLVDVAKGVFQVIVLVADHPSHQVCERVAGLGQDLLREKRLGVVERNQPGRRSPTTQALAADRDEHLVSLSFFKQTDIANPVRDDLRGAVIQGKIGRLLHVFKRAILRTT